MAWKNEVRIATIYPVRWRQRGDGDHVSNIDVSDYDVVVVVFDTEDGYKTCNEIETVNGENRKCILANKQWDWFIQNSQNIFKNFC